MGKRKKFRTESFSIRLNPEENEKLVNYAKEHGLSKTQTMVKGLETLYSGRKQKVQGEFG